MTVLASGYSEDQRFYGLVAGGDEAAWRALLTHLGPMMLRLIGLTLRGAGDSADIQDLFQVAAVRAWRWRGRYDPDRGSLRGWVGSISISVAAEFVRRERRQRKLSQFISTKAEWLTRSAGESETRSHLTEAVQGLLLNLPHRDRELVRLYVSGHTYDEIAHLLGTTSGAARTRMTRLRTRLRDSIDAESGSEDSLPAASFTLNGSRQEATK